MSRKKTLLNGELRPAVRRHRAKRRKRKRAEWLAQFAPGARDKFFSSIVLEEAVFLNPYSNAVDLPRDEAAKELEQTANELRWRKLRTLDGTVIGIAPPRIAKIHVPEPSA